MIYSKARRSVIIRFIALESVALSTRSRERPDLALAILNCERFQELGRRSRDAGFEPEVYDQGPKNLNSGVRFSRGRPSSLNETWPRLTSSVAHSMDMPIRSSISLASFSKAISQFPAARRVLSFSSIQPRHQSSGASTCTIGGSLEVERLNSCSISLAISSWFDCTIAA